MCASCIYRICIYLASPSHRLALHVYCYQNISMQRVGLTGQLGNAGQRSILDIQKEEAERTRAQREAAEKAAAAAGLPAPSPAAGGWAKIAGGGASTGSSRVSPPLYLSESETSP